MDGLYKDSTVAESKKKRETHMWTEKKWKEKQSEYAF